MMERICILMFKPLSIKWIRNSYSRDFQTELKDLIFKIRFTYLEPDFGYIIKWKKDQVCQKLLICKWKSHSIGQDAFFLGNCWCWRIFFIWAIFQLSQPLDPDPSLGTYLHNSRTKSSYKSRCENHFNVECKQSECPGYWQRYWNKHERFSSSMLDDQAGTQAAEQSS